MKFIPLIITFFILCSCMNYKEVPVNSQLLSSTNYRVVTIDGKRKTFKTSQEIKPSQDIVISYKSKPKETISRKSIAKLQSGTLSKGKTYGLVAGVIGTILVSAVVLTLQSQANTVTTLCGDGAC